MQNPHLRNSDITLAKMIEMSPIGAYVIQNGKYMMTNQALAGMFGYACPEQIEGLTVESLHPIESHEFIRNRYGDCLLGKEDEMVFQVPGRKYNGQRIDVSLHSALITFKGAAAILTYATAVADSPTTGCIDSIHASKIDSVAALAGGIAHEFNNALACLTGNLELLRLRFVDHDGLHKYVESMWESAMRMRRNTEHLLAYAQDGFFSPERIDMDHLIRTIVLSLRHRLKPDMSIHTDIAPNLADIKAHRPHMHILLSSVLSNAVEAIDSGGLVKVTAATAFIDRASSGGNAGIVPGHFLHISIVDDGKGMDQKTLDKAFEPFFTTKMLGRGLGLSAAHGIAAKHGGMIKIKSALGNGTKVCIYLPSLAASLPSAYSHGFEEPTDLEHNHARRNSVAVDAAHPKDRLKHLIEHLQ